MTEEAQHQISMPEGLLPGVYADFVTVWHGKNAFVLDFAAMSAPPQLAQTDDGREVPIINSQIVARVRIPPEQVFEIMKALEQQLTAWESQNTQSAT